VTRTRAKIEVDVDRDIEHRRVPLRRNFGHWERQYGNFVGGEWFVSQQGWRTASALRRSDVRRVWSSNDRGGQGLRGGQGAFALD
jgi:hypothetical protein